MGIFTKIGAHVNRWDRKESVKKKFSLPDQFILNVGTIESRKNLHAILNAVKIMKNDVPLVVVGRKTKYMNFVNIQLKKMKIPFL